MTLGLTETEVRAINLIEVLQEKAEEEGRTVSPPPEEAKTWSEAAIRAYFASGGKLRPAETPAAAHASQAAGATRLPPPDAATFQRWFPGLPLSRTACDKPVLRVLCFANAGNAEDMYTSEGTGVRKAASPLLEWCRSHSAECLAPQYPGRAMRLQEERVTTAADMAAALLPVVASRLYDVPWVVVAHSVGTWIAFEFLQACRAAGVPPPRVAFLSAMPSPDIPLQERPWRRQCDLDEAQFQEECRGWDISDVVFSPAMWPAYQPLLRADFTLFDSYKFEHQGGPPFDFPLHCFWGSSDRRVREHHVRGWGRFTHSMTLGEVQGNHLWPLDKAAKAHWLGCIAAKLQPYYAAIVKAKSVVGVGGG